jgi:solute carrier family 50 protein (sugar transporter)
MYRAKALGKAHHVVFDQEMHTSVVNRLRLETDLRRALERGFTAVAALLVAVAFGAGMALHRDVAEQLVGNTACVAAVCFYLVPLSTLRDIVRTRNASSLSLPLCLASLANACLWTVYGAAVRDASIVTPNVPGILAGLLQLAMLARYGRGSSGTGGGSMGATTHAGDGDIGDGSAGACNAAMQPSGVDAYDALETGKVPLLQAGPGSSGGRDMAAGGAGLGPVRTLSPRRLSGQASSKD